LNYTLSLSIINPEIKFKIYRDLNDSDSQLHDMRLTLLLMFPLFIVYIWFSYMILVIFKWIVEPPLL